MKQQMPREATPTEYKGITFRSKTEAVYARMFDLIGWVWEYEPEVPGWPHNPDFLVGARRLGHTCLAVIEVKPSRPTKAYLARIKKAAAAHCEGFRHVAIVLYGNPWEGSEVSSISMRDGEWQPASEVSGMMHFLQEALKHRFDLENPSLS